MIETAELVEPIWERDPRSGPGETRRTGSAGSTSRCACGRGIHELMEFAAGVDVDDVVLLGMGGSSLAPEVMRRLFEAERFHVLDTTHPTAIRRLQESIEIDRTLFLAASKSGTTLETRSHVDYFRKRGGRFAVITDPGSPLAEVSEDVFYGEPTIGGRYSALSVFGIRPAIFMGIDVERLLDRAEEMREACRLQEGNPGLVLGLQLAGTTFLQVEGDFGLWVEQLVAESTGEEQQGHRAGVARWGAWFECGCPTRTSSARSSSLGVRDRRGRLAARDQPVQPAGRSGSQGPRPRPSFRGRGRGLARAGSKVHWTSCSREAAPEHTTSRSWRSSTPPVSPELEPLHHGKPRRPVPRGVVRAALPPLDRTAPQGAGPTTASSSRWSTIWAMT